MKKLTVQQAVVIQVRTLSTGLLRQLVAEIKQQQARNRAALTPGPPADEQPEN
jgi:hypothetical protein